MRQDHFLTRFVPKSLQKEAAQALAEIASKSPAPKAAKRGKTAKIAKPARGGKKLTKAGKVDGRALGVKLRWAGVRYGKGEASEADIALLTKHGKIAAVAAAVEAVTAPVIDVTVANGTSTALDV